jgi:YHS domain-containing protein
LAIQGYDPVAYFTDGKAVKGDSKFQATSKGATYYFASDDHRAMFEKEPAKYEPLFGGYCGYGASKNRLIPIEPDAFAMIDGHLVLQKNKDVLGYWNEDPKGTYEKAQANWPKLVEKNGK